jgi:hypothetical protein
LFILHSLHLTLASVFALLLFHHWYRFDISVSNPAACAAVTQVVLFGKSVDFMNGTLLKNTKGIFTVLAIPGLNIILLTLSTVAVIAVVATLLQLAYFLLLCVDCVCCEDHSGKGVLRQLSAVHVCSLLTGCLIWSVEAGMRRNHWMISSGENTWTLGQMLAVMVALYTICTSLLEFAAAFRKTSSEHSEGVYFNFTKYLDVPK